jgi:glycerol uptake facilitator-like aquaporin
MIKQRHVAALLVEFFGTLTLSLVVLSVSLYRFPFFTALAAGVTIAVFVSAFAKISGGHLNPAVTVGMFAIRQVTALRAVGYIAVQMLAGFAAWQLYEYLTDRALTNATTPAVEWNVVAAEAIGAFIFGLALTAAVTQKLKGYQAAYTMGAGLFLGLIVSGLASNSLLNPAVAVAVRSFDPVTYVAAPVVGFLVGATLVAYVIAPIFGRKTDVVTAPVVQPAVTSSPTKTASAPKKPAAKKPATKKPATKKTPAKKK